MRSKLKHFLMVKVRLKNGKHKWVTPNIAHGLLERGEATLVKPRKKKEVKKKKTRMMKAGGSKSYKTK